MCYTWLAENTGCKNYTKNRHLCTIARICRIISSQLRHVWTIRKTRLGFVTAPTSLNGGQPNFAQCLAVSWAGALYVHFWGLSSPNGILPGAKFTLRPCLALSYIGIVTARRSSRAVCVSHCLRHGIFTRQGGHPIRHWAVELFSFYSSTGGLLAVSCQTNLSIIVANAIFSCY